MFVRKATEQDIPFISQLFKETIETINAKDYNEAEVKAWSAGYAKTDRWIKRLTEQYFIVATSPRPSPGREGEIITGIGSINPDGYLDMLYVHKDYQGRGVASALVDELISNAVKNNLSVITSDVSITARPFFESKGFTVVTPQQVMLGDVELMNYKMEKKL